MKNFGFRGKCVRWLSGALLACLGAPAIAATYTVTNANDSGAGSLRQAMLTAIVSPEADTIEFAINGVITLQSALPDLADTGGTLTVIGNGANNTIIDGADTLRPFSGNGIDLIFELRNLTVRHGRAPGSEHGGAIRFTGATLIIKAVEFRDNSAAPGGGGAIFATANTIRIEDSAFRGNSATGLGSSIGINDGGDVDISNSTFLGDGNTLSRTISIWGNMRTRLMNTTVHAAGSAFGIFQSGAEMLVVNSLLTGAGNTDFWVGSSGTFDSVGSRGNVIGSSLVSVAGGAAWHSSNQLGVSNPLLGSIGNYGGPTSTMPLLPGSLAIDAGVSVGSTGSNLPTPVNDQRGVVRSGAPDVGAYESRGFTLSPDAGNNQTTTVNTSFANPLVVTVTAINNLEPVTGGAVRFIAPASGASATFASLVANIDSNGYAQTAATANATAGGPYSVTATLPGGGTGLPSVTFSLTNSSGIDPACVGFTFPYTLLGADNAARVIELRQAIECANANTIDDEINLAGHTLVFNSAVYTDPNGANALPFVTSKLTLVNGALERDASAPAFRFLDVPTSGNLTVRAMQLRNGWSQMDGGAIRADGMLTTEDSVFEDNIAATRGGAIATHSMTNILTSRFARNDAPDGAAIAGGDADAVPGGDVTQVVNSRLEDNGGPASRSVIWNKSYFAMAGSLVIDNHLTATGSSLLAFTEETSVAELRNVTIADNSVQSALFGWTSANVQLQNSIVWNNQYGSLGRVTPRSSIGPGFAVVITSLDQPPGFVGPGDYHLDAGSPAIDAGDNSYGWAPVDLDGNPRLLDDTGVVDTGIGNAPITDIGAYEYQTHSVAAGITVTPISGLVTTEAGGAATFTVVLDRYPAAAVALSLASSNPMEGMVIPTSLSFTQANWNQPQIVTVIGLDDGVIDGNQPYTIMTGPADSADPAYNGIDPPNVSVINEEEAIPPHQLGGTVIGLLGQGLVLTLDDGSDPLAITANGNFIFNDPLGFGETYSITVLSQPLAPAQVCVVLNGEGMMGAVDINDVVVNCGASNTHAVGGTVSGLTGGGLTLQLNGSDDLPLSANGSYTFLSRLVDGAAYLVSVSTQPQGQLCTLTNASGIIAGADISDVNLSCAPLQANLQLSVDDGRAFARYGHVRDYFITLGNTGNMAANGVAIAATFSAAFDVPNVHWLCVGGGANCGANGSGGFSDVASVPANSSLTWIVSVPVLAASNEPDATLTIGQPVPTGIGFPSAADTNTLVIFRDGFDVPYADGTQALDEVERLSLPDEGSVSVEWPPGHGEGIRSVRMLEAATGTVEVQGLIWAGAQFLRLLATDASGQQQVSDWASTAVGAQLVISHMATQGTTEIVLLEGASRPLALRQVVSDNNGEVE